MKKLLFAVMFVSMFAVGARAEEGGIYFEAGSLEMTYPLSNLSAISLYDFWHAEGLVGGETRLAKYERLNINLGVITSLQADGCGFVSLDMDWSDMISNLPPKFAKFGIWYGRDFKREQNRAGVKASVALW